jgi:hypothetical protein
MRVVSPYDRARLACRTADVIKQRFERLHHMRVAQIPGLIATFEHRSVVLLGIPHQSRVLLRKEVLVRGDPAVAGRVLGGPTPQVDQLRDDGRISASACTRTSLP